ncbi:MAG TPA: endonuclease/exonuclease/phosphatase family protein [Candidatus Polarisedimenticolaceae bacterium]|nr:endonuclease/exonuclease/phosphatase family protein [Candidatus Polarisedimenticolaceae bacterium]
MPLLRLLVWNCSGRLHDKLHDLTDLAPDVAVLPECACPEVLLRRVSPARLGARDLLWDGTQPSRGLAVATFGSWRVRLSPLHRARSATTLPVVLGGPAEIDLVAIWARPPKPDIGHRTGPEPLREALARVLPGGGKFPIVLAGDFNRTLAGKGGLRADLALAGFVSAYHHVRGVPPGDEGEATFYRLRRFPSRHHLDQVLVNRETASRLRTVELHGGSRWSAWSDHVPLVVEIEVAAS